MNWTDKLNLFSPFFCTYRYVIIINMHAISHIYVLYVAQIYIWLGPHKFLHTSIHLKQTYYLEVGWYSLPKSIYSFCICAKSTSIFDIIRTTYVVKAQKQASINSSQIFRCCYVRLNNLLCILYYKMFYTPWWYASFMYNVYVVYTYYNKSVQ